jgi:hypothetical protein
MKAFISLQKAAKDMHLQINQEKTKYMPVTKEDYAHFPPHIETGPYQFHHSFTYLGSKVNCKMMYVLRLKNLFSLQTDAFTDLGSISSHR